MMASPSLRSQLPFEIYLLIAKNLKDDDPKTLSILSRTARTLHQLLTPLLETYLKAHLRQVMGWAVSKNSAAHTKRCIDLGIRLPESEDGANLLKLLVWKGCDRAIGVLIDHGMDPLAEDRNGSSPMCEAVRMKKENIVKVFVENGVNYEEWERNRTYWSTCVAIHYLHLSEYFGSELLESDG
ncbi:hypothetical protein DFP73DRAFT_561576 [Morchella snyderi]|nr:hypothetical protein DFP73DRAFT_561576 [Morchella snyderi]